jgi:hypothetical protein
MKMDDLSPDELLALNIAAEGGSIAAIARWKAPVERLLALGLLHCVDAFNNVITPAGVRAWEAFETEELWVMAKHQQCREGNGGETSSYVVIEGEAVTTPDDLPSVQGSEVDG